MQYRAGYLVCRWLDMKASTSLGINWDMNIVEFKSKYSLIKKVVDYKNCHFFRSTYTITLVPTIRPFSTLCLIAI